MSKQLLSLLFILVFAACKEGAKPETKEVTTLAPQYYYFPRANVYFDSANKNYVFLGNDGKNWETARQIPNVMQGLMDKSILVQSPSDPVWKDNEKHKLVYSALLYATPNDTVAKKELPKIVERVPSDSTKKEEKKRKGVRKIIDKIFGIFKKDKKKKDTAQ